MSARCRVAVAATVLLLGGCGHEAPGGNATSPVDRAPPATPLEETTASREPQEATLGVASSPGVLSPEHEQPVPGVVGMEAGDACRALLGSGYSGGVFGETAGARPGRVVKQDSKPGYLGGEGQLVHLIVSKPFPRALATGHPCVDRRPEEETAPPG